MDEATCIFKEDTQHAWSEHWPSQTRLGNREQALETQSARRFGASNLHRSSRALRRDTETYFIKTQTLTADLMTHFLSLEPREKIHVCGSAECAQVWFSVYTSRRLQGLKEKFTVHPNSMPATIDLSIATMTKMNLMRW